MEKLVDGILVVPNRRLKSYLKRDVNQRAQASNLTYTQTPDIRIESDDDVYIGRVLTAASSTAPSTSSSPNTSTSTNATIDDVINSALSALGSTFRQNIEGLNKADIDWVATQTGFTDARNKILRTQSVNRETLQAVSSPPETGIIVSGAAIESVTVNPKMSAERLSTTDATTLIRIGIGEPAGSVALVFKEGTGTVVAAIESYIANIAVNNGEVIDISYILYWQSKADLEEINQIHASIGAAARFGGFRVNGDKETRVTQARAIGDRIRVEKGIDPTLGILAAYAYSDGNLQEQVNSVDNIMREYIGVEIFDVAMLAGTLRERSDYDYHRLAPFCPMLSQGFFLIEILGKYLSKEVKGARSFLRPALWTTFDGEGMKILIGGLKNGALM